MANEPDFEQVKRLHGDLTKRIRDYDRAYYERSLPLVSDAEYDELRDRIDELEREYPELKTLDSPTQRVGSAPSAEYQRVEHRRPMLSLSKANRLQEVKDFIRRIGEKQNADKQTFIVEEKVDGLSLSLRYENGTLQLAATRGNGYEGENITDHVLKMPAVPNHIRTSQPELEVRGEIYMTKQNFIKLNKDQVAATGERYATPRNSASGMLRRKNASSQDLSLLDFFAYELFTDTTSHDATDAEHLRYLATLGFRVIPHRLCSSLDELTQYHRATAEKRSHLPYDIDGLVCKINDLQARESLGVDARSPRWAFAYKFSGQTATTVVADIKVQVGRLGTITPVAVLEPVNLGGVFVTRASLHNEEYVQKNDIRVGDTVKLVRAGDVIPQIAEVVTEKRSGHTRLWQMPSSCPVCGTPLVGSRGGGQKIAKRCPAVLTCPAQLVERLKHFVSRDALNIWGLAGRTIALLLQHQWISTPSSIFTLAERSKQGQELQAIPDIGQLTVNNLLGEIERRRVVKLDRFIYSLSIPLLSLANSRIFSEQFGTVEDWWRGMEYLKEQFVEVEEYYRTATRQRQDDYKIYLQKEAGRRKPGAKAQKKTFDEYLDMRCKNLLMSKFEEYLQKLNEGEGTEKKQKGVLQGIGAQCIYFLGGYLTTAANREEIHRLMELLQIEPNVSSGTSGNLRGEVIVFTGALTGMTRPAAERRAETHGATVVRQVTKQTTLLVRGAGEPGSKVRKAEELEVTIIDESQFLQRISNQFDLP